MPAVPTAPTVKTTSTGKKAPKPGRDMSGATALMQALLAPSTATGPVSDEVLVNEMDRAKGINSDHLAAVTHVSRTGYKYLKYCAVKIEFNIKPDREALKNSVITPDEYAIKLRELFRAFMYVHYRLNDPFTHADFVVTVLHFVTEFRGHLLATHKALDDEWRFIAFKEVAKAVQQPISTVCKRSGELLLAFLPESVINEQQQVQKRRRASKTPSVTGSASPTRALRTEGNATAAAATPVVAAAPVVLNRNRQLDEYVD
jgi:hypothetical protein